jgi:amino acid adenylation domain-containing protein
MEYNHLASYIRKHAANNPTGTAIKYNGTTVTYGELERESNRIADILYKKVAKPSTGGPDLPLNVATILNRSPEIIISIIGILKAGAVFVPIDTNIPQKRLEILLSETKAQCVITTSSYYNQFKDLLGKNNRFTLVLIDTIKPDNQTVEPEFELITNKYCYIYFTSGSTGIPKGVLGRHKSLHHYIRWQIDEFNIDGTFRVSQLIPPTFDPYLRDIFVPLMVGGAICIPDYNTLMNPVKLIQWIDEEQINLIHIVPSLFKLISDKITSADQFLQLKYVFLAGEMLKGNDIRRFIEIFADRIQLVNQYGPTETTLAKFFYRIKPGDVDKAIIPVGKPITGAEALILDQQGQKCLTGNIGEIYIRTPFISSGYFNKKELNKEVFVKNPFSNNKNDIIYKSGDLGRLLFDGNIELTGRVDNQIKIRGNRVEPGEIENLLLNLDHIKEAVVVDREDQNGEKFLCAYLVMAEANTTPDINRLKTMLAARIPHYMVPSYFITLESIPLNPNGKIDRQALKNLTIKVDTGAAYTAPEDELGKKIAEIWQEVLNLDKVGINDIFFNVGGTSLNAIRVISKISEILAEEIPIVKFFEYPTIRLFVKYLKSNRNSPLEVNREENSKRMDTMVQKRSHITSRKDKLRELRNG